VAAIAEEARVALKTVYTVFGTKAEVLRVLLNLRMRGDDEPLPLYERPWYREIVAQPDPEKKLELLARASRLVKERTSDTLETSASGVDGSGHRGGLRAPGELALEPVAAADMLWTLNHPDVYQLLVRLGSRSACARRARGFAVGTHCTGTGAGEPGASRELDVRLACLEGQAPTAARTRGLRVRGQLLVLASGPLVGRGTTIPFVVRASPRPRLRYSCTRP
jgi:AcrR family transcriptional regulator